MFKKIKIIIVIILVIVSIGTLSGCKFANYYPEYESEFYRYAVKTRNDGTKWAYLIGLTELGAEQTELIYPEKIDGIPVYGIAYNAGIMPGKYIVGHLKSERLEKLFLPTTMKADRISVDEIFGFNDNVHVVYWSLDLRPRARLNIIASAIFGYNYVEEDKSLNTFDRPGYIGNVSYLYNYDNASNNGYYWVDSYDESVITFIPPIPDREGYQFGGWYKEPECSTKWDFETDVTGKEFLIDGNSLDNNYLYHGPYEGIYLYAKWIKA